MALTSPLMEHIRGKDSDKAAVKAAKICKIVDVNECACVNVLNARVRWCACVLGVRKPYCSTVPVIVSAAQCEC